MAMPLLSRQYLRERHSSPLYSADKSRYGKLSSVRLLRLMIETRLVFFSIWVSMKMRSLYNVHLFWGATPASATLHGASSPDLAVESPRTHTSKPAQVSRSSSRYGSGLKVSAAFTFPSESSD